MQMEANQSEHSGGGRGSQGFARDRAGAITIKGFGTQPSRTMDSPAGGWLCYLWCLCVKRGLVLRVWGLGSRV
jgi:hypothetical protein